MRTVIAAVLAGALSSLSAAPALAAELFDRNTMLGWRQQTGPGVVAYFRAPIGPVSVPSAARVGLAVTGPRAFAAGEGPLFSAGPRVLDFTMVGSGVNAPWNPQLRIGKAVAWSADPEGIEPGQINLMESGLSWAAVGAITVGLAAATLAIIEADEPAR